MKNYAEWGIDYQSSELIQQTTPSDSSRSLNGDYYADPYWPWLRKLYKINFKWNTEHWISVTGVNYTSWSYIKTIWSYIKTIWSYIKTISQSEIKW